MDKKSAFDLVSKEYDSAIKEFPPFNSRHEGKAVIEEEFDELWDDIKANAASNAVRAEAVQVAAMAIRFLTDCCE